MDILAILKLGNGLGIVVSMNEDEKNNFEVCYRAKKMNSGFRVVNSNTVELFIGEVTFSLTREEMFFLKDNPSVFIFVRPIDNPHVSKYFSFSLDKEMFLKIIGAIEFLGDFVDGRTGKLEITCS